MAAFDRLPPPGINPFRPFVTNELKRRRNQESSPIASPFVRMTSCLQNSSYKYFTLGLHGYTGTTNIFDVTYGGGREIVGYAFRLQSDPKNKRTFVSIDDIEMDDYSQLSTSFNLSQEQQEALQESAKGYKKDLTIGNTPAGGAHPIPGIVSVNVNRYAMGAGIVAEVQWYCYNRLQLEFLRHHFMTVGSYVVLEWGHQFTNANPTKILNFGTDDTGDKSVENILAESVINGREKIFEEYCQPNNGNYDFIVGSIGNYRVELDAESNIYKVTTVLHSSGEYLWGLRIPNTSISLEDENVQPTLTALNETIEDFFKEGGSYDVWLKSSAGTLYVTQDFANFEDASRKQKKQFEQTLQRKNVQDYQFVSFSGLFGVLVNMMFKRLGQAQFKIYFENLCNFDIPNESKMLDDKNTFLKYSFGHMKAGYNKYLLSTDPETMILITPDLENYQMNTAGEKVVIPEAFQKAGKFGEGGNFGYLHSGVWLNSGMIRECFLQAATFEQAMRSILTRMNNATSGYWNLILFYDDVDHKYKIIDFNYTAQEEFRNNPRPFYRFNTGTRGECLSINLDSAFPPEVITQLSIVAKMKASSTSDRGTATNAVRNLESLLEKYPMIGKNSHYALALNWTNFRSTIDELIMSKNAELSAQRTAALQEASGQARRDMSQSEVRNAFIEEELRLGAPSKGAAKFVADERLRAEARGDLSPEVVDVRLNTARATYKYGAGYTEADRQRDELLFKFGNELSGLYVSNSAEMIRNIAREGISNVIGQQPITNAFMAPFPTTAKIEIEFQGVSGISIFDGFLVDKLPYLYDKHGIFHVTEMKEKITRDGWTTVLIGIFRFLSFSSLIDSNTLLTEPRRGR